jgi:hypothetical protein
MAGRSTRREFLQSTTTGGIIAATGGLAFFQSLPRVSAEEAKRDPKLVPFDDRIEPLVKLIEETPRNRMLEQVADRIRKGTSYQEVLAALLLAGVRNVQPYPSVGFKFHAVLVVNSCHLASLAGPDEDRWLPIFWALDYFKSAQADEASSSGWRMKPVDESRVPDALQARKLFFDAMDRWDKDQADVATAGLVRTAGATEVFNLFAQYAARDYRSIGHKAIFLANAWRTLQVIGWEFAEPVMRSLAFALLNHTNEPNPAENDLAPDRPWRQNAELISKIPDGWLDGRIDSAATRDLFPLFRESSPEEAAATAVEMLEKGVSPQSIWDGIFVGAGELLMRQPAIVPLHNLTTANAVYAIWQHAADEELRKRLLLQACSFNTMFRESAQGRGNLRDITVEKVEPIAPQGTGEAAIEEILADISGNATQAAAKVRGYLAADGDGYKLIDAARRMIFFKGRNSHDYKFSSAVLEDFDHVSGEWRDRFLALSVFNLKGSGDRDSGLVERTRSALQG